MTERHAETVANIVIGVAAVGAAVYVLKTPALRRLVWGLARTAFTAVGPAWLMTEARRGWDEGGDGRPQPAI
jgi:apolipoprotein N-acyltransferase